jgi:isopropylmalate/homocitrate/citramalate synthase
MIWLIDSTLRDGEQTSGVVFGNKEKIRIAQMLDEIGIDELEAGTPAMGENEQSIIRAISRLNLHVRISVWCRAVTQDIELAAFTEILGVHIAFPVSDIQLSAMYKDWEWEKRDVQAFDGKRIGRECSQTFFGKHSDKGALIDLLKQHDITLDKKETDFLLLKIKETTFAKKQSLSSEEVIQLYF